MSDPATDPEGLSTTPVPAADLDGPGGDEELPGPEDIAGADAWANPLPPQPPDPA